MGVMKTDFKKQKARFIRNLPLHFMMLPGVLLLILFSYVPMAGVVIAFQKFIPAKGLFGNQKWIGLDNFTFMFSLPQTKQVFYNTIVMAVGKIILGIIIPVLVALLINEVKNKYFKRSVQTLIYFPYFISWVILAGILIDVLSPKTGIVNSFISFLGVKPIFFLGDPKWFQFTMIASDTWKTFGFGTVVYLAAITSIDPTLYEAAVIDGAGRVKQTIHITLPGISMIVILLSVLSLGNILNAGFDQIYNLSNPAVYDVGEIIDTMVYRTGILGGLFGPATAIGLLKSVVSLIMISTAYLIAYKKFDYRVF